MKRVLVLVPFPLNARGVANRQAQTREVLLRPDVTYEYRAVKAGPTSFVSPHDWGLLDVALFEAGLNAESEGYDAVVIDTVSDSGSEALRSMLDIPVLAPGRASLLFALTLGRRFGILAQWEPSMARYRKVIPEWGFADLCAGVEHFDTPPDFADLIGGKEAEVLPKMEAACERLVVEGADVIALGSTTMHQAHGYLQERLPVPIINPGPLSYKLIESLLVLGLSHSRRAYPRPLAPKPDVIHAMLEAARGADR
ncbi:MAG TPA: aspartate/glutamate racemase family protein [Acidimicrobiia bacterium]|jgi:allantoin racemase|nr:aspartate/glutamate racemase family protein [Acidimicrobiia bacterium]